MSERERSERESNGASDGGRTHDLQGHNLAL